MGKVSCFHGRPDKLDRREFGSIGGISFNPEPVFLIRNVFLHLPRPVRGESIPDEKEFLAPKRDLEILQQFKEIIFVHTPGLKPKEYPRPVSLRSEHEYPCHRQAFP